MDGKLYKFRNENTSYILTSFFATAQLLCININITSNLGELKFDKTRISGLYPILLNSRILKPARFRGNDEIFDLLNRQNLPDDYDFSILNNENLSAEFISEYSFYKYNDETFNFENCISYYSNRDNIKELAFKLSTGFFNRIIIFDTRFNSPKFKIKKIISLNELQKIDTFKIEKKPFN